MDSMGELIALITAAVAAVAAVWGWLKTNVLQKKLKEAEEDIDVLEKKNGIKK
jgi:hypothetical protein